MSRWRIIGLIVLAGLLVLLLALARSCRTTNEPPGEPDAVRPGSLNVQHEAVNAYARPMA